MKKVFISWLAATVVCLILSVTVPTLSIYAQDSVEELRQRMRELEEKNHVLQDENNALKQKISEQTIASSPAVEQPIAVLSLREIPETDPSYQFLTLGQSKDYLKTERRRIIDQIEQAIPPLYEPIAPFHGYTLPPGIWRAGSSVAYGQNNRDFGRDKFYASFFNQMRIDFTRVNFDLLYGFEIAGIHDLTLTLNIPYLFQRHQGTGHPFNIDNIVMSMEGAGRGLGDLSLTLKKKWIDQGNTPLTFSTMLGAIFPTAQDEQKFSGSQVMFVDGAPMAQSADVAGNQIINVFGRKPGDRFFPRGMQPGNGSWGARFGFGATRQFQRSALHGGAIFDLLADNNGITPGNELKYGISYVFPVLPSDHLTLDLGVRGAWKGNEEFPGAITHAVRDPVTGRAIVNGAGMMQMFTTDRPDFKHGNILFFSPSFIFIPRPNLRMFANPSIRIYEPDKGPSPEWSVTVGSTVTF